MSSRNAILAIMLMEEVVVGLDVVKTSLDHAVMVFEDLLDDLAPHSHDAGLST